jgi:lipoate---protein ligase
MKTWRLLDTGRLTAAENMALDEVLLKSRARGWSPNTIRFLQMSKPAVLIGFIQNVEQEVRTSFCKEHDIDINRRVTGGGTIYFDESQLGWEVICDRAEMNMGVANSRFFEKISQPSISSLATLGVEAEFRPLNDIEVNGRKISGTGGTEEGDAFLFQGTLLVDFDVDTMMRALKIPIEKLKDKELASVRDRVTCLAWELGRTPSIDEIKATLVDGFEKGFGIHLVPGGLTSEEKELLAHRIDHYRSDVWINKIKLPKEEQDTVSSLYKAPGGLIRVSLLINQRFNRIRYAYITGDFFAYPQRAIFDLEAALKESEATKESVDHIVTEFFQDHDISIPGVDISDVLLTLHRALDKIPITKHGIPLHLTNHIFTVCGSFDEVLSMAPLNLLLPYCAKSTECGWRYEEDCPLCGDCTIDDAVALGNTFGFPSTTIQNFEHLMETLEQLKADGATSFIGCCCEAFFAKHNDDFEQAGLPGILLDIDNTTCYDLGKEEDAYQGKFENQTTIKLDLLEMVLTAAERNRSGKAPDGIPVSEVE